MILKATNLRVEYKHNPIGLGTHQPRLSWEMISDKRNAFQKAYQVICAQSLKSLNSKEDLLWDSQKVISDESIHILYNGKPLISGQKVFWKVRIWDEAGEVSEWSETSFWQMGLINVTDWQAQWIESTIKEDTSGSTPCQYFRKEFSVSREVSSATLYITSRGLYESECNGEKIGDELFTPGWTSYHHRLQYQAYDITKKLKTGTNAIGVILGDGWYRGFLVWQGEKNLYGNKTALLCQLEITYRDGSKELICSDNSWKSSTGPILSSDIYNGEAYDANQEQAGWSLPGFKDHNWQKVDIKNHSLDNLVCSEGAPVRITETIKPIEKIITPKGEIVFDLGQNIVGWVRFSLVGTKNHTITIQHAEVLDQEGNFYVDNLRGIKAEETYTFKSNEVETYEPRFTFHDFRYFKVTGYSSNLTIEDFVGCVVHSDMKPIGDFECSNELVNRLQNNIQWGLRGNFLDVPTDCPQRDERLGWTGDAQVFAPTACFNMDTSSFFRKWMKDFIADQKDDGSVPWVVPNVVKDGGGTGWSDGFGATGWADAAVIIPWNVYLSYGDKRILADQYDSMKGWEEYMIRESGDSFIFKSGFHFGDWLSFAEYHSYNYNAPDYGYAGAHTDKELIATAYFYYTTSLMQKIATILENENDANKYADLLPVIKDAFCKEFLTASGRLTSHTQTAYILALSFGLLPKNLVDIAAKRLADDIDYFGHLTTGFLGTPLICQALSENGKTDIAYKLLFNKRYPSWLYPVTMGATTIWERWDGIKPDGSFQTVGMNSFNHYAYGAIGQWLYSSVAGINLDENKPAYKQIVIKPQISNYLSFAKATHHSVFGEIISFWNINNVEATMELTIPANTSAKVYIPCQFTDRISESGNSINANLDIKILKSEGICTVLEIGSGLYKFNFPNPTLH